MKLVGNWLKDQGLQQVLGLLADAGHQAFLVGGCVRNDLLNQPVADIDIATDALPARVCELAHAAGLRSVPTGIDHGTVTVLAHGAALEVTTFRRDVATDGRRAVVAFSTRIEEDAARRDFTMNALYADREGQVIDPLGGLPDLRQGKLRFVGDARQRIREDYLRILRFFRFHAWYGNTEAGLDPDALSACAELSAGIDTLSRERIGHEMRRLLAAPDPAPSVAAMQTTGVLARVLPGADSRALAPLIHLEATLPPDWLRRLCVLGGEGAETQLRMSRDEVRRYAILRDGLGEATGPGELGYRHGAELARDIVLLRAALTGAPLPSGWGDAVAQGAGATFPVKAADLPTGLSGPQIGRRLKDLEARWIASGFTLSREQLLA
ncbi:MAG: CCA tRNA nucleotidyltransferase [Rhodobacteraceae bacterium]|nr:CCA tRNA nucleotidyltransferase [Paracoccaceae bacterium]